MEEYKDQLVRKTAEAADVLLMGLLYLNPEVFDNDIVRYKKYVDEICMAVQDRVEELKEGLPVA